MENRAPAVAGRFYPADPAVLARDVEACLASGPGDGAGGGWAQAAPRSRAALGVMVPHAGYIYSGSIAGATFAAAAPASRALVMAPNHTGRGAKKALFSGAGFRLPGGDVLVDAELTRDLLATGGLTADASAHEREHAVEVELPFLRARCPDVRVTALCLAWLSFDDCRKLAEDMTRVLRRSEQRPLLVASSDMSHYISGAQAAELDGLAIERMLALDPEGLYRTVVEHDISMCGFVPTTVMLLIALALGAKRAELVRYGNSGDYSGDHQRVVGYAGVIVD